jgi:nitroimidazol reductase NimA-like FMN-containing flavoprotein (pyridoxamine 5'-phosphate oxidase superfamily)
MNPPAPNSVRRAIAKHSFCTLATSTDDRPHAVGVLYVAVDGVLFVSTHRTSKKARNVMANPRVAVCIPIRRYPMAPPFLVQFAGQAQLLANDDPTITALGRDRRLKKITSHGELADPDSCFLRIAPERTVHTYGLEVPLKVLLRDPLHASRSFALEGS